MPCPRGPSRGRRREKDSTKITTCTTILDPLNVNSKLRLLIRGITIQLERERERETGDIWHWTRKRSRSIRRNTNFLRRVLRTGNSRSRKIAETTVSEGKIRETSGIVVFVGRISRKDRSSSGVHMACRENSSGKRCETTREERAERKRSENKKRRKTVYSRSRK